ncbi:hypothetical protein [Marinomonas fungiae]|uniref:hypothetical protein n=1 Tax=Marinomonas fungiae TaxID=1137284 RepID=UPI003A8CE041
MFNAVSDTQLVSAPIQLDSQGSQKIVEQHYTIKADSISSNSELRPDAAVDVSVSVVAIDAEGREENVDLTLNETIASQW